MSLIDLQPIEDALMIIAVCSVIQVMLLVYIVIALRNQPDKGETLLPQNQGQNPPP